MLRTLVEARAVLLGSIWVIGIRKDGDLRYPRPDVTDFPVPAARMCIRSHAGVYRIPHSAMLQSLYGIDTIVYQKIRFA